MKRLGALMLLLAALGWLQAADQGPEDRFIAIYNLIQQADALRANGQPREAQDRYLEARAALEALVQAYPRWNDTIVNYRRKYLAERLGPLASTPVAPPKTAVAPSTPAAVTPSVDERAAQIVALNQEIANLRSEREALQAKLREALSVQPAAADPRELARAEDRARDLQKENELLKRNLAQQQDKTVPPPAPAALAEAQRALKEANQSLARQTQAVAKLTRDKEDLQQQLKKASSKAEAKARREAAKASPPTAPLPVATQPDDPRLRTLADQLRAAQSDLAAEKTRAQSLEAEKGALQKRVSELAARPSAASAVPAGKNDDERIKTLGGQLRQAQAELEAEKARAKSLEAEKAVLEKRVSEIAARPPAAAPSPKEPASTKAEKAAEKAQLKQLEKERDELRGKVAQLNRQLDERRTARSGPTAQEMADQLGIARARLQVYEARQVPYTAEELAMMRQTTSFAPAPETRPAKKTRQSSAPVASLVAEAQRAFDARRFDEAESKLQQAVKLDEKNLGTVLDLAAAQIEQNRLDAAEANLKRVLAEDANDAQALSLLGVIRLKQEKVDEAFDALSRAALQAPGNPVIQNHLGVSLSRRGQRIPAETAFRKAIQLRPEYAEAHNNLGVVYATQRPPFLELARWHYQKALANGHPKNPELEKALEKTGGTP